MQTRQQ
jgi:hypothetical protein